MTFKDLFSRNKIDIKSDKRSNDPKTRKTLKTSNISSSKLDNFGNTINNINNNIITIVLPEPESQFLKNKDELNEFKVRLRQIFHELNPKVDKLNFDIVDITQTSAKIVDFKHTKEAEVTYNLEFNNEEQDTKVISLDNFKVEPKAAKEAEVTDNLEANNKQTS